MTIKVQLKREVNGVMQQVNPITSEECVILGDGKKLNEVIDFATTAEDFVDETIVIEENLVDRVESIENRIDSEFEQQNSQIATGLSNIKTVEQNIGNKVDTEVAKVNAQLSEKANKNEIFSMVNMGQDIKEAMTGGSVAVVGVNCVGDDNLIERQISPSKTTFVTYEGNLIDESNLDNGFIRHDDASFTPNDNYRCTNYIYLESGIDYNIHGARFIAVYNANKEYIQSESIEGDNTGSFNYVIQLSQAGYIRCSFRKDFIGVSAQVEKGNKFSGYKKMALKIESMKYEEDKIDFNFLKNNEITPLKTNFICYDDTRNRVMGIEVEDGILIENGSVYDAQNGYVTSQLIELDSDKTYYSHNIRLRAYYDEYCNFITSSFYDNTSLSDFDEVPLGKYIKVTYDPTKEVYFGCVPVQRNSFTIVNSDYGLLIQDGTVYYDPSDASNVKYKTTDFIKFFKDFKYSLKNCRRICFYDEAKQHISDLYIDNSNVDELLINANATYIRITYLVANSDVVELTPLTDSNAYDYRLNGSVRLEKDSVTGDMLSSDLKIDLSVGRLKNKTIFNFGDSIAYGANADKMSYAHLIRDKYKMQLLSYAVGGATICRTNDNNILDQLTKASSNNIFPDYILFNGATNDCGELVPLGSIANGYNDNFDENTFCGAFESICKSLKENYLGSKILYIRVHNMSSREASAQKEYGEKALEICRKWSIPYVDIYNEGGLNTNLVAMRDKYTHDTYTPSIGDATHPNKLGYETYYVPLIEAKLKTL